MNHLLELLRCPLHPDSEALIQDQALAAIYCTRCCRNYPVTDGIPDLVIADPASNPYLAAEAQQWDAHAPRYDEKRQHDLIYRASIDAAVQALNAEPGDAVLDAACGTGMTIKAYLRPGIRVVALDLSLESLRRLRAELDSPDVVFLRGDLLTLPFAANSFTKVLCANAIQHLPQESHRRRCVQELARVARPGARVVVTAHNHSIPKVRKGWPKEGSAGSYSGAVQYIYRYDAVEFRRLLACALDSERVTGAGLPLPYRFKLGRLSQRLECFLRRFPASARWSHMLVGVGQAPHQPEAPARD
jgi:ubiquinone/menaquinone biosynthesis C-methylase UbiE/uncharacterized protein YbaR (Trm112 family)